MRVTILFAAVAVLSGVGCSTQPAAVTSPALSSDEFRELSLRVSEPGGAFVHADNLVSNEVLYAQLAQMLRAQGGAYIGVGPEQNFSYIARIRPEIAFIVDIRQDNRNLHLIYKALFELAHDRAEFVSRLFSRSQAGLRRTAPVAELFTALDAALPREELLRETQALVRDRLLRHHRLSLADTDLTSIDRTLRDFFAEGPAIRYGRALPPSKTRPPYRTLMTVEDLRGNPQSYLASDEAFQFVRSLHERNLIIPVIGNFAGSHALRTIGDYLRHRGTIVSVFYASNVEVYLSRDQRRRFCGTLAALPHDRRSYFVGSRRLLRLEDKLSGCARLGPSLSLPKNLGDPDADR